MEIVSCFLAFERQATDLSGWCNLSVLHNFSENEIFAGEALVLKIFFSYSPVFSRDIVYFLSCYPKNIHFYKGFPTEKHSQ